MDRPIKFYCRSGSDENQDITRRAGFKKSCSLGNRNKLGLKKAVQGVGERHLLGGLTVSDRFLFGFNSLYSVFIGAMQLPAERVTEMVESYFLFNFCSYIGKALCYGLESLGTGSRLSMFAGIEIDRALILRAASSSGKLVKKLE